LLYIFIYLFISFPSPVLEMAAAVISGYKLSIYFSNLNEYVIVDFFSFQELRLHMVFKC